MLIKSLTVAAVASVALANDNGLALKPPMGWRSWNLYGANVNQDLITGIMDGMVKKIGMVNGKMMSLCDLGYCDVGLDDNWQVGETTPPNPPMHYHKADGTPQVNLELFPDFKKMTDHAHSLGLTSGWYGNNCIHSDHCRNETECQMQIKADVTAMRQYGFDSWKLDGCGGEHDLVYFNKMMQEIPATSGRQSIMVENCHWGPRGPAPNTPDPTKPPAEGCPWNFYRSSGDVRARFSSIMGNLQSVEYYSQKNLSYPGCWAYPDMLQVGCAHGPGGAGDPGLSDAETRVHFYGWCIVSSPLTLSHDVNNDTINQKIWPVISNTDALAVSQTYAGFSGGVFSASEEKILLPDEFAEEPIYASTTTMLWKPLDYTSGEVAVLIINSDTDTADVELMFKDIPHSHSMSYDIYDIHEHKDLGSFTSSWKGSIESHDCAFLRLTPKKAAPLFEVA